MVRQDPYRMNSSLTGTLGGATSAPAGRGVKAPAYHPWGTYGANMQYLLNPKKKKSSSHIWTGADTACRLYSTGGMVPSKQQIFSQTFGKPLCQMCITASPAIVSTYGVIPDISPQEAGHD